MTDEELGEPSGLIFGFGAVVGATLIGLGMAGVHWFFDSDTDLPPPCDLLHSWHEDGVEPDDVASRIQDFYKAGYTNVTAQQTHYYDSWSEKNLDAVALHGWC